MLSEDREKLRVLQPLQPWFTQEQREELAEVHPWIQQHTIPPEIDTQVGKTHALSVYIYHFILTWVQVTSTLVSFRVVWAAAQRQGPPTLPFPPPLTARVLWTALSRTPLDPSSTPETLQNQKNRPPHPQQNQPCQKSSQLLPHIFFWPTWRTGLCLCVKLFCNSGWICPQRTQEARVTGIFTVSRALRVSLMRLPLTDQKHYTSWLFVFIDPL